MCDKNRYPDKASASTILTFTKLSRSPKRQEKRVYYCRDCEGYHLTSKPYLKEKK